MNASTKPAERHPRAQDDEPAKGGIKPPHDSAYPSGDTPKPHGDKFQQALDESAERKKAK